MVSLALMRPHDFRCASDITLKEVEKFTKSTPQKKHSELWIIW